MTTLEILLLSSIVIITIDLVRAEKNIIKLREQIRVLTKKYLNADHDIKTLHLNQKMLQSSIKEFHRDLKVYGEVKRSKVKELLPETPENW